VIFTSSGRILFSIGSLTIFDQGLINGLLTALRLILLVSGTSLVTLTTTPIELTDGLERLLAPLKTVRIPTHELAMMMTLALRFIPILVMETERIMKAQMARGADYESGNMVRRAKSFVPLLIPLFVSILRRADELALAMDSRCYRGDINRTRMHQLKLNYADIMTFIIYVFVLAGLVFAGRY
jgi:energy-coupling factor transport system permease protein